MQPSSCRRLCPRISPISGLRFLSSAMTSSAPESVSLGRISAFQRGSYPKFRITVVQPTPACSSRKLVADGSRRPTAWSLKLQKPSCFSDNKVDWGCRRLYLTRESMHTTIRPQLTLSLEGSDGTRQEHIGRGRRFHAHTTPTPTLALKWFQIHGTQKMA